MGVPEAFFVMLAALPLIFGLVPRNRLFGFRTRETMQSDEIWYRANRRAGVVLFVGSTVWAVAAGVAPRSVETAVGLTVLAVTIAVCVWVVFRTV